MPGEYVWCDLLIDNGQECGVPMVLSTLLFIGMKALAQIPRNVDSISLLLSAMREGCVGCNNT